MFIRAVRKTYCVELLCAQALDISGSVFDIDVCTNLLFGLHEAQIPIRDSMVVEPIDRLSDSEIVEVVYEEAVSDNADASSLIGQHA